MKDANKNFTLEELCTLVEMDKRTIRFYMQKKLVDRPKGTGKGAFYTHRHLEQLLAIRKWKAAGLSLDRIFELITNDDSNDETGKPLPPPRQKQPGDVEVWSHLHISDGVELHIEPRRSGLTPEQVRALFRLVLEQVAKLKSEET